WACWSDHVTRARGTARPGGPGREGSAMGSVIPQVDRVMLWIVRHRVMGAAGHSAHGRLVAGRARWRGVGLALVVWLALSAAPSDAADVPGAHWSVFTVAGDGRWSRVAGEGRWSDAREGAPASTTPVTAAVSSLR